ncbi:hypothetical protein EBT25_10915, partial [bacterium]|nr:hypothetical protein [bacterium]
MDPFTLFALAQGAVAAVKKGCDLYKEIKGVAGNVKDILKDLDQQFHKKYEGKRPPAEAVKQLNEEKKRVKELGEKNPDDIYAELGEQLGAYYENYAKCQAIFDEEEKRAHQVYVGDTSLGKRALQRVLMRKKLEQMGVELREVMVYQSPPELGSLYSDVSAMMTQMMEEQRVAIAQQIERDKKQEARRKAEMRKMLAYSATVLIVLVLFVIFFGAMALVVQDRI